MFIRSVPALMDHGDSVVTTVTASGTVPLHNEICLMSCPNDILNEFDSYPSEITKGAGLALHG
jgi:hypothetical protein